MSKDKYTRDYLGEMWNCNRKIIDGKWYVEFSQVVEIISRIFRRK